MKDSSVLPELRMLPAASLRLHEEYDPRRLDRLCERLRQEGILKNPPVVTEIPGTELYVVLDGANRALAFQVMGLPHIVAQRVSYKDPGVVLDTWYHVVSGMMIQDFEQELTQATGLRLEDSSLDTARRALGERQAAAYIVSAEGVRIARSASGTLEKTPRLLHELVSVYKGRADIHRASNDIWEIQVPYYPKITALVIFPTLSPDDILQAALSGEGVPTGITRHIINNRALNINIPLAILEAGSSLEIKEKWLDEWLLERMAANAIRYYSESTFSYNE